MNLQILDCTLRDGAYIVDGNFGEKTIKGIVQNLVDSKIDLIEVGWLKNNDHVVGSTYYQKVEDIIPYLPKLSGKSFIAMVDYGRYDLKYLLSYDGSSIDTIRLVFPREKFEEALDFAVKIKEKGYKVCLQAANTLSYSDKELKKLAEKTNVLMPESLSIVDTFGIMYKEDLIHIYNILNDNLNEDIKIGFHSHNNLQMSFALSIEFICMAKSSKRAIIVDSSLVGMGRGAGNTCTELLVDYVNKKNNKNYDYNRIMDTIDVYIRPFINNYNWGYTIPYCIAGQLGSHVNNIAYLQNIHKTKYKDMKLILEMLEPNQRKLYDYDKLEDCYVKYFSKEVNDENTLSLLKQKLQNKNILLLCPGASALEEQDKINSFINEVKPIVIGVNAILENFNYNYLFFSNKVRFDYARSHNLELCNCIESIITSNIKTTADKNEYIVNFNKIMKLGWKYFDNSTIMAMRLLEKLGVLSINIAGCDGYNETGKLSYSDKVLQSSLSIETCKAINKDVQEMFNEFRSQNNDKIKIKFITKSIYE